MRRGILGFECVDPVVKQAVTIFIPLWSQPANSWSKVGKGKKTRTSASNNTQLQKSAVTNAVLLGASTTAASIEFLQQENNINFSHF